MHVELRFHLSGTLLFKTTSTFIPPVGSRATITTNAYKSGLFAGSIIEFEVGTLEPIELDYTDDGGAVAHISVNGYEVIKAGPEPT